jgi:hypothetical protein
MKLLFHSPGHHKNTYAIKQMCASRNIELEFTHDDRRINNVDYDIIILNSRYINPDIIPQHVKIIYGPQHFIFPSGPLCGPIRKDLLGRAVYNTLSLWNRYVHTEFSTMIVPYVHFPYAVDVERFKPLEQEKHIDCIIYIKHREPTLTARACQIIDSKKLNTVKFIYGSYNEGEYLSSLQKTKFMITLDAHESQGFALQEAMSCNVPLLVLDATTMKDEFVNGKCSFGHLDKNLKCTSVPYWDERCGIKTNTIDELSSSIDRMLSSYTSFNPRQYILETLTPEVCMDRILHYFKL